LVTEYPGFCEAWDANQILGSLFHKVSSKDLRDKLDKMRTRKPVEA